MDNHEEYDEYEDYSSSSEDIESQHESLIDQNEELIYSKLPVYNKCTCGKWLTHDDFILYMLEIGMTFDIVSKHLQFISLQNDCCKLSYSKLSIDFSQECLDNFNSIKSIVKKVHLSMSVYYLINRGVGVNVVSHLLRVPQLWNKSFEFTKNIHYDCPICKSIIPNKEVVKYILDNGESLNRYLEYYDIPNYCCITSIKKGSIKIDEVQNVETQVKGVPVEEQDFVSCMTCGSHLSGIHDLSISHIRTYSSKENYPENLSKISGDCIRTSVCWGLPMELAYKCHNVVNLCCKNNILSPDSRILSSNQFDIRKKNQIYTTTVHVCY